MRLFLTATLGREVTVRADGSRTGRKDGGDYARLQFERHVFPTLGDTTVTDTKKSDVLAILDKIKAEGKLRTANILLTELKQMFRFALAREIVERNPLDVVTKRDAGGSQPALTAGDDCQDTIGRDDFSGREASLWAAPRSTGAQTERSTCGRLPVRTAAHPPRAPTA